MLKIGVSLLAMLGATTASADIYKCTDGDGRVTYSNVQGKSCTRLISANDAETKANTMSPPPPSNRKSATANPTPANFPRVDGNTQRSRDDDRRRILENELAAEQKGLEDAKKSLAEQEGQVLPEERVHGRTTTGSPFTSVNDEKVTARLKPHRDRVALHERNIEALKKEIGNLR